MYTCLNINIFGIRASNSSVKNRSFMRPSGRCSSLLRVRARLIPKPVKSSQVAINWSTMQPCTVYVGDEQYQFITSKRYKKEYNKYLIVMYCKSSQGNLEKLFVSKNIYWFFKSKYDECSIILEIQSVRLASHRQVQPF